MIQSTDLRIGNWVKFDGNPDQVVYLSDIFAGGKRYSRWAYPRIDPIELTPEILEKAGFSLSHANVVCHNAFTWICLSLFGDGIEMHFSASDAQYSYDIRRIYFVHELQNYFHSMSGEELNIHL